MFAILTAALIAGLVGSPHCVAMCGGLAVAASRDRSGGLAWSVGRLTTYTVLGALVGAGSGLLPGPAWLATALALGMLVWFSATLAGVELPSPGALPGLHRLGGRLLRESGLPARYGFGVVSALMPCGLVYTALALPLASGSAAGGAATMFVFGLGTLPALSVAAVGLRRLAAASLVRRRLVAAAVLGLGVAALAGRHQLGLAAADSPVGDAPPPVT